MIRYTVCGSFDNPKKAREYARFSSPDYTTRQEAEAKLQEWQETSRYTFAWIEERGNK